MIAGFTAKYCVPHAEVMRERVVRFCGRRRGMALRAAAGGVALAAGKSSVPEADGGVQSPEEEVTFTFASEKGVEDMGWWRARVTVPPVANAGTMLGVEVEKGGAAADGMLELAGAKLPVRGGKGQMLFGAFLAGLQDTEVRFTDMDGDASEGRLLFF